MSAHFFILEKRNDEQGYSYFGAPESGLRIFAHFLLHQPRGDADYYKRSFLNLADAGSDGDEGNMYREGNMLLFRLSGFSLKQYPYSFIIPIDDFLDALRQWELLEPSHPRTIRLSRTGTRVVYAVLSSGEVA